MPKMNYKQIVEKVAITIYQFDGGMDGDTYAKVTGETRPAWVKQYDFQKEELAEHERDDYRVQAHAVVDRLLSLGVIDLYTKEKE